MIKTKDEILMVALGVKQFSTLEKWQKEQLYYAMDEWATINNTAQLQQHAVGGPVSDVGGGEQLGNEGSEKSVCVVFGRYHHFVRSDGGFSLCKCGEVSA